MLHYALFAVIVLAVLCYMDWQIRRVFSFYGIGRKKWYVTCFRAVLFSGSALLIILWPPGVVVILHFLGAFIVTNLVEVIIKRISRHRQAEKSGWFWKFLCRGGILQVLAVFLMMGYGYYNVGHIDRTEYIIETDKISDDYRIVFISDTHYGTVQNPAVLQELMAEIGTLEPDFIVLGGDIVEGGTSWKVRSPVGRGNIGRSRPGTVYYHVGSPAGGNRHEWGGGGGSAIIRTHPCGSGFSWRTVYACNENALLWGISGERLRADCFFRSVRGGIPDSDGKTL